MHGYKSQLFFTFIFCFLIPSYVETFKSDFYEGKTYFTYIITFMYVLEYKFVRKEWMTFNDKHFFFQNTDLCLES